MQHSELESPWSTVRLVRKLVRSPEVIIRIGLHCVIIISWHHFMLYVHVTKAWHILKLDMEQMASEMYRVAASVLGSKLWAAKMGWTSSSGVGWKAYNYSGVWCWWRRMIGWLLNRLIGWLVGWLVSSVYLQHHESSNLLLSLLLLISVIIAVISLCIWPWILGMISVHYHNYFPSFLSSVDYWYM